MRLLKVFSCALLVLSAVIGFGQERSLDIVKIKSGMVSGMTTNGVHVFKGVPFAAPPVNELRWKAPQPVKPWQGTLSATQFGPSPFQSDPKPFMMWTEEFITPPESLSEDCLYLNVWTPALSANEKLPVLVWIYGGGFMSGSGACQVYDGEEIAKQGIVYVTINYRVGVFGFMAHPELSAEVRTKSSGNYGLLDQIAALKWVRENIASFGGDPEKVTIAGQSAGSMSVQALVASPLAKGLFRGAIAQSGSVASRPSVPLAQAEKTGLKLSDKVPSKNLAGLRSLSADSLLGLAGTIPFGTFAPITDGYVIPEDAQSIFRNRKHNDVPVIAGWVSGDADLVMGPPQAKEKFTQDASSMYGERMNDFLKLFPVTSEEELKASQRKLAMLRFAGYPDYQWASINKSNTYLYYFTYVPTDKPGFPNYGAFHTSEVPFALHTLSRWDRPWTDRDRRVERTMSAYWVNFVKTGNPNGSRLPEWTPYSPDKGSIMEFGGDPALKPKLFLEEFKLMDSAK
jgi:para-nitrobenzyl esterase